LIVALSGLVQIVGKAAVAPPGAPNILIILTDDQRSLGTLGVMPYTRSWLKAGGTAFPNAFVTTPLCCPSRAALLTGMYAHNTGITVDHEDPAKLAAVQSLTMESVLQPNGYLTGMAGKYFNGWPNTMNPAYFDKWAVTPHVRFTSADWNIQGVTQTLDTYTTTVVQQQALSFLDWSTQPGNSTKPWFLYLAPMAPHMPATPEPKFANAPLPPLRLNPAMRETDLSDKTPFLHNRRAPSRRAIQRRRAPMLRTLMSVDSMVNTVMLRLQSLGELDNTLVVFASDNGFEWGEHGILGKCDPYLESVKVPLLIRWPGHFGAGVRDDRLVALLDLAPTIFHATGIAPTHPLDGIDLLDPSASRKELLLEYHQLPVGGWPSWNALISAKFEFIQYRANGGNFREYYNLKRDPYQLVNLLHDGIPANPSTVAIRKRLRAYETCAGSTCPR
jgi:arylsulfatase A-like enzyme